MSHSLSPVATTTAPSSCANRGREKRGREILLMVIIVILLLHLVCCFLPHRFSTAWLLPKGSEDENQQFSRFNLKQIKTV